MSEVPKIIEDFLKGNNDAGGTIASLEEEANRLVSQVDAKKHEELVKLGMKIVRELMEKTRMDTKCKCGHSVFDHSDDIGCDAKGCTCSMGFEDAASEIFTKAETEIDNLHREVNILKAENYKLKDKNHSLRVRNDNEYDGALEWAAEWITGAQLLGRSQEIQEYARNMAMSIRAAKRGLTRRALDVCPSCAGKGTYQIGVYSETCSACHGTGTRQ